MESINLARKITTNAMGLDSKTLLEAVKAGKGKYVEVSNVLAMVSGYSQKPSKFDAAKMDIRFHGKFEATNLLTGEIIRAGDAYFPGGAADWLKGQVDAALGAGKKESEFTAGADGKMLPAMAFTITAKAVTKRDGTDGYEYGVKALVETGLADPFAELRKALPKPKK